MPSLASVRRSDYSAALTVHTRGLVRICCASLLLTWPTHYHMLPSVNRWDVARCGVAGSQQPRLHRRDGVEFSQLESRVKLHATDCRTVSMRRHGSSLAWIGTVSYDSGRSEFKGVSQSLRVRKKYSSRRQSTKSNLTRSVES